MNNPNIKNCPKCYSRMYKAMKSVGPQVWVCSNLECRHLEERRE